MVHADARVALRGLPGGLHAVLGDAFHDISVPAHLVSVEFAREVGARHAPAGFYAVTAMDHAIDDDGNFGVGKTGDPASNFRFVEPKSVAQPAWDYREGDIYVVPNPATTESMSAWALQPNNDDPTGIKVEFRNLPRSEGKIRIYTVAGDLVKELSFDGGGGAGTVKWDLVSRSLQDVTSGVYVYSVETADGNFDRFIGKFVVIR